MTNAAPGRFRVLLNPRVRLCALLGFTSGMPLWVLFVLVPAWLRSAHVDLAHIGLFALTQLPYTWKFLWSPLVDRYRLPRLGRRKGVMLAGSVASMLIISAMGRIDPLSRLSFVSLACVALAFASATLDIAIDAFRRELLRDDELGPGNGVHVTAYKLASLVPGSLALVLSDHMSFASVFLVTGLFMLPGIVMSLVVHEPEADAFRPKSLRDAVIEPFREFISRDGLRPALVLLAFMLLYKLGDAMSTALITPFYIDLGFTRTQIGLVAKNVGLWASVVGGMTGAAWLVTLGINRALWIFGGLQLLTILCFLWLAHQGPDLWALGLAYGTESFISVGLATAAFSAFLARSTDLRYTATQFALFSSLVAVPRALASGATGYIVEATGWTVFFAICALLSVPGLLLLPYVAPWNERLPAPSAPDPV
jgi:PAT family beta-lactamase induction signal transducer AmpG